MENPYTRAERFFKRDIWAMKTRELPRGKAVWYKFLRVVTAAVAGFQKEDGFRRASALTFYTLLSVVPILALVMGVAKGFGFQATIESQLHQFIYGQEEVVSRLIQFALAMLEESKAGVFAGVGIVILFWSVIRILRNLEDALNHIWGTPGRTIPRMITDYLAVSILAPMLWLIASTGTVVVARYLREISESYQVVGWSKPLLSHLLHLLPYSVIALALAFVYIFLPNRAIRWRAGFMGGVLAGAMYLVFQWVYISFQVGVSKYSAVYGGFAALPLFVVWLNVSWIIVLFGAEVSFAFENARTWGYAAEREDWSPWRCKTLALLVGREVAKDFAGGKPPRTAAQIADALDLPPGLVNRFLDRLIAAKVIHPVCADRDGNPTYAPARPISEITAAWVLERLEHLGEEGLQPGGPKNLDKMDKLLESFQKATAKTRDNKPLHEL
ncbi:MAG: YihY/virulence factor BrkB family protein [Deltaproteobacteria bacterium]|nr:YihY/virulence factor BrkB family protein [Deltaproteobacteria bacterium]